MTESSLAALGDNEANAHFFAACRAPRILTTAEKFHVTAERYPESIIEVMSEDKRMKMFALPKNIFTVAFFLP